MRDLRRTAGVAAVLAGLVLTLGATSGLAAPPPFDESEDDFKRLRAVGALVQIDSDTTTQGVQPLAYCVNHTGQPAGLSNNDVDAAIAAALAAWQAAVPGDVDLFSDNGTCDSGAAEGVSEIGWGALGAGVVGQSNIEDATFVTNTLLSVSEASLTLNNNLTNWAIDAGNGDFGVQDVIAHEAGHWVGLDHVQGRKGALLTMYSRASTESNFAQSLGCGDMLGAEAIYGDPNPGVLPTPCN
jgi:Matrixin